jgi:hypothetical protein
MMPPEDPAPASEESSETEKEKGPPSRGKIGWSLCVLAIVLLTTVTTMWLHSTSPDEPLSTGAYSVVAAMWTGIVLGIYYWRTKK